MSNDSGRLLTVIPKDLPEFEGLGRVILIKLKKAIQNWIAF